MRGGFWRRALAVFIDLIGFGIVLPLLPTTATTGSTKRLRQNAASPPSAASGSATASRLPSARPASAPARAAGNAVTFEPGARTAWHTHPLGQTLIVTFGRGWAQREGGPIEEIRPGDVVWFAPGEKHWHGATATTAMTHLAIQERLDGKTVGWMEQVSDEQYQG